MNKIEKHLIYQRYISKEIDHKNFIQSYPSTINKEYLLEKLNKLERKENGKGMEYFFYLKWIQKFDKEIVLKLCQFLKYDWHSHHEEIVHYVQFDFPVEEAVEPIIDAIISHTDFLNNYEMFINQAFFAIGTIGNENAIQFIYKSKNSENPSIKSSAEQQIRYIENPDRYIEKKSWADKLWIWFRKIIDVY